MINDDLNTLLSFSDDVASRLTIFVYWIFNISGPLLICFMINYDISKDLNTFILFPDQGTPLILTNNLRIILDSKPEKILKY